jgi:hypothetical protein
MARSRSHHNQRLSRYICSPLYFRGEKAQQLLQDCHMHFYHGLLNLSPIIYK